MTRPAPTSPSASGPPRCGQSACVANSSPSRVRNTATRSDPTWKTRPSPAGMIAEGPKSRSIVPPVSSCLRFTCVECLCSPKGLPHISVLGDLRHDAPELQRVDRRRCLEPRVYKVRDGFLDFRIEPRRDPLLIVDENALEPID